MMRILCALFFSIAISVAAAGPLTAEIKPVALRARAFAPEALDVKLTWSGSGLLEGALEFSFPGADENAPRFRSHDLALTSGAKEFQRELQHQLHLHDYIALQKWIADFPVKRD